jgi:hypothetical protein
MASQRQSDDAGPGLRVSAFGDGALPLDLMPPDDSLVLAALPCRGRGSGRRRDRSRAGEPRMVASPALRTVLTPSVAA